ncbi:MAG: aromatic amino acid lyase, partial [Bdellovibrionota bacterium]
MESVLINGRDASLDSVWRVAKGGVRVELAADARAKMVTSRTYIETKMKGPEAIYGVNTGFGAFSSVRISDAEIDQLQRNLIRSHSCG